jgi:hypothetical protein
MLETMMYSYFLENMIGSVTALHVVCVHRKNLTGVKIAYYTENAAVFMFTGEPDECLLSNRSSEQPDWRIKYHGDYKGATMPVCSQDLFCWAFQVARGMEYLASRKVRRIITVPNMIIGNN